ncbi:hypothetical protein [Spartinivicinus poritis]|uniref:Uncharacterized protein n=1 Tax=Spartinivicinus poritis TaxID=2994640 RepID=A0ABT5U5U8_9GAMM|nr:hypothetical protein [Spartinivicinus sp. A2-2]MDE1461738.1 hypothetical protein [Spartinivicinus sp. A2-2]
MTDNIWNTIKHKKLDDIIHIGVVDFEDKIAEVTTFHTHLFLEVGQVFVKLESIEQYSRLKTSITKEVDFTFDFEIEEEMSLCKYSAANVYMTSSLADNKIDSITFYGAESVSNQIECLALSIKLDNGQVLFFDPTYLFGIKVGSIKEIDKFIENSSNHEISITKL